MKIVKLYIEWVFINFEMMFIFVEKGVGMGGVLIIFIVIFLRICLK